MILDDSHKWQCLYCDAPPEVGSLAHSGDYDPDYDCEVRVGHCSNCDGAACFISSSPNDLPAHEDDEKWSNFEGVAN